MIHNRFDQLSQYKIQNKKIFNCCLAALLLISLATYRISFSFMVNGTNIDSHIEIYIIYRYNIYRAIVLEFIPNQ